MSHVASQEIECPSCGGQGVGPGGRCYKCGGRGIIVVPDEDDAVAAESRWEAERDNRLMGM